VIYDSVRFFVIGAFLATTLLSFTVVFVACFLVLREARVTTGVVCVGCAVPADVTPLLSILLITSLLVAVLSWSASSASFVAAVDFVRALVLLVPTILISF